MLPQEIALNWYVVETPAMVARAKALENNELKFSSDIESLLGTIGQADSVFTSGTIQCVDDPYKMVEAIVRTNANYIMFARGAFVHGGTDLIVNHKSMLSWNGKGPLPAGFQDREVAYPYTFVALDKFTPLLSSYDLILTLEDTSGMFPVNNAPTIGLGLLYKRKDAN